MYKGRLTFTGAVKVSVATCALIYIENCRCAIIGARYKMPPAGDGSPFRTTIGCTASPRHPRSPVHDELILPPAGIHPQEKSLSILCGSAILP